MRSEFGKGDCRQEAMESLKQAAIHLIKDNIDLKSLLNEVPTKSIYVSARAPSINSLAVVDKL